LGGTREKKKPSTLYERHPRGREADLEKEGAGKKRGEKGRNADPFLIVRGRREKKRKEEATVEDCAGEARIRSGEEEETWKKKKGGRRKWAASRFFRHNFGAL